MLDSYDFNTLWTQYHHHSPKDPFPLAEAIKIITTYTLQEHRDIVDRMDGSRGKALHPALLDLLDSAIPALQDLIQTASRRRWASKVFIVDPCDMNIDALRFGYTFTSMNAIWSGFVRRILIAEERFKYLCFPLKTTPSTLSSSPPELQQASESSRMTTSSTCHVTSHALPPSSTNCLVQSATASVEYVKIIETKDHSTNGGGKVEVNAEKTKGIVIEGPGSVVEGDPVRSIISAQASSLTKTAIPVHRRPLTPLKCSPNMPGHVKSQSALVSPPGIAPAAVAVPLASAGAFALEESLSIPTIPVAACQDAVPDLFACPMHRGLSPAPAQAEDSSASSNVRLVPGKDPPIQPHPSTPLESAPDVADTAKSLSPFLSSSGLPFTSINQSFVVSDLPIQLEITSIPRRARAGCEAAMLHVRGAIPGSLAGSAHIGLSPVPSQAEHKPLSSNNSLSPGTSRPTPLRLSPQLDFGQDMQDVIKVPPLSLSPPGLSSPPIDRSFMDNNISSESETGVTPHLALARCDGAEIGVLGEEVCASSSMHSLSRHDTSSISALPYLPACLYPAPDVPNTVEIPRELRSTPIICSFVVFDTASQLKFTSTPPPAVATLHVQRTIPGSLADPIHVAFSPALSASFEMLQADDSSASNNVSLSLPTTSLGTRSAITPPESTSHSHRIIGFAPNPVPRKHSTTTRPSFTSTQPLSKPLECTPEVVTRSAAPFHSKQDDTGAVESPLAFRSSPGLPSTPITRSVMDVNTSREREVGATPHLTPLGSSALIPPTSLLSPNGCLSAPIARWCVDANTFGRVDFGATLYLASPSCEGTKSSWSRDDRSPSSTCSPSDSAGLPRMGMTPPIPLRPLSHVLIPNVPGSVELLPPSLSLPGIHSIPITRSFGVSNTSSRVEFTPAQPLAVAGSDATAVDVKGAVHGSLVPVPLPALCSRARDSPERDKSATLTPPHMQGGFVSPTIARTFMVSGISTHPNSLTTGTTAIPLNGSAAITKAKVNMKERPIEVPRQHSPPTRVTHPTTPPSHPALPQPCFANGKHHPHQHALSPASTSLTTTPSECDSTLGSRLLLIPSPPHNFELRTEGDIASAECGTARTMEGRDIVEVNGKNNVLPLPPTPQAPTFHPLQPGSSLLRHICVAPALLWSSWEADVKLNAHGVPERLACSRPKRVTFSYLLSPPQDHHPLSCILPPGSAPKHTPLVQSQPPGLIPVMIVGPLASTGFSTTTNSLSTSPILITAGKDAVPSLSASPIHLGLSSVATQTDTLRSSNISLVPGMPPPIPPRPAPLDSARNMAGTNKSSPPFSSSPGLLCTPITRSFMVPTPPAPPLTVTGCDAASVPVQCAVPGSLDAGLSLTPSTAGPDSAAMHREVEVSMSAIMRAILRIPSLANCCVAESPELIPLTFQNLTLSPPLQDRHLASYILPPSVAPGKYSTSPPASLTPTQPLPKHLECTSPVPSRSWTHLECMSDIPDTVELIPLPLLSPPRALLRSRYIWHPVALPLQGNYFQHLPFSSLLVSMQSAGYQHAQYNCDFPRRHRREPHPRIGQRRLRREFAGLLQVQVLNTAVPVSDGASMSSVAMVKRDVEETASELPQRHSPSAPSARVHLPPTPPASPPSSFTHVAHHSRQHALSPVPTLLTSTLSERDFMPISHSLVIASSLNRLGLRVAGSIASADGGDAIAMEDYDIVEPNDSSNITTAVYHIHKASSASTYPLKGVRTFDLTEYRIRTSTDLSIAGPPFHVDHCGHYYIGQGG